MTIKDDPTNAPYRCPKCGGTRFTVRGWVLGFCDAELSIGAHGRARFKDFGDEVDPLWSCQRWNVVLCADYDCGEQIPVDGLQLFADLDLTGTSAALVLRSLRETGSDDAPELGECAAELRRVGS
jgi:hypothetical protein